VQGLLWDKRIPDEQKEEIARKILASKWEGLSDFEVELFRLVVEQWKKMFEEIKRYEAAD
jgi:hypothetical protein